jgi:hypothetical protein
MDRRPAKDGSRAIAQGETQIGFLIDRDDPRPWVPDAPTLLDGLSQLVAPPATPRNRPATPVKPAPAPIPAWTDAEPITVCDFLETALPKEKVPSRPALRSFESPGRPPFFPAVSELLDEPEPPLVIRVSTSDLEPPCHDTAPRKIPDYEGRDRTAPVRAFADRLPGTPKPKAPRVVTPRSLPNVRVRSPEDTLLEGVAPPDRDDAKLGFVTAQPGVPNRYVATVVTPKMSRNALVRMDTHLLSAPPTRSLTFASVTLSVFLGVAVMLAVLYQLL